MTVDTLVETPDSGGAFPRLAPDQIGRLARAGRRRMIERGDVLVQQGQRDRGFFVVLRGLIGVFEEYGAPGQHLVRVHGPGRFLDEIGLLTGQPSFVSYVAESSGEVLELDKLALRDVLGREPKLADLVLRAFICRRELLVATSPGIRILGSRFSPDTRRLREFCARNRVPHSWIDVDEQGDAEQLLQQLGIRPDETPVVIFRNDQVLRNPTNRDLGRLLGMSAPEPVGVCDLLVVGAGPAGLAAAVYGASEGLQTIVVDSVAAGGQAATSSRIENYLGFPAGISGAELAERAAAQAKKFGATITVPAEAVGLDFGRDGQVVTLSDGGQLTARVMVIATGARYRRLDVPRLAEFEGSSIFYAATYMEARFCDRRPVVVVGGGNSAGQAVLYLSRYAADVTLLVRHDDLNQDMSRYLVDQIENTPAIDVRRNSQLRELEGRDGELESIIAVNHRTGKQQRIPARVMFVFIGALPCTAWLRGAIALDDNGYVQTGPATTAPATGDRHPFVREVPGMLETNQPGVLAVGDVRSGSIKRVASAVGEGATAVRLIHDHLAKIGWMGARSNHPT